MQIILLTVSPLEANNKELLKDKIFKEIGVDKFEFRIAKRSIDARRKPIKFNLKIEVFINETAPELFIPINYQTLKPNAKTVIIIGFGPAGMFAALKLIKLGIKPIILERGKEIKDRRRDIALITKKQMINPNSNYCFGEGGAGTFSDGKLYTRSKKRGNVSEILNILVQHGAPENITIDAHPHIGTNKLPKVVTAIRETILKAGGAIHFNTKVVDLIIENQTIKGVLVEDNHKFLSDNVILATGHSARDIYYLLEKKAIKIESKPFALGVRVEHSQQLIDKIQYHGDFKNENLPPAAYQLVQQVNNSGVFSFCMCPGGIIAPCATSPGEIVTNGWSPSKRNNPFANSGIVVTIEHNDLKDYEKYGNLAGLKFQEAIEKAVFMAGGNDVNNKLGQVAPAQRLLDFINNKKSTSLPKCSYLPGVISAPLHQILPKEIVYRLQQGFISFGKKMKGYLNNEAIIVAVESRTSSPVKIPRDKINLQHVEIKGLYPCGEGAGYAGGIVSAAIDGQKCAEAIGKEEC